MNDVRTDDAIEFPRYGARARVWARFERDLRAWLATPDGRFAAWRAATAVARGGPRAHDDPERSGR
ncbi:hypothetical protein [Miltoncostaea marina]|uniref:hypothetical protein n=1 Tax=Miltoncostaea marina TaxID=2843215 RepID=UPI001C3C2601|nr:hypothetical protein [Miltoncostaea marina]